MAYVALDRFRYTKTILDSLNNAKKEVEEKLQAMGHTDDSILARIQRHIKNVEGGLCIRLFFGRNPNSRSANDSSIKMFGSANRFGWDVYLVSTFLLFLFCSLLAATCFNLYDGKFIFWLIFILSSLGIIVPYIFILMGASYIKFYKIKIDTIKSDLDDYKLIIPKLQQEVKQ